MKKRFTEEQIIGFLHEADAGMAVKDLCRRHGFSDASYYLWRSKFGGSLAWCSVSTTPTQGPCCKNAIGLDVGHSAVKVAAGADAGHTVVQPPPLNLIKSPTATGQCSVRP